MAVYDWILGAGLMFGFAIFITLMIEGDITVFFIFLTIMNGFVVWAGFLELWTLIINLIVLTIIIFNHIKKRGIQT